MSFHSPPWLWGQNQKTKCYHICFNLIHSSSSPWSTPSPHHLTSTLVYWFVQVLAVYGPLVILILVTKCSYIHLDFDHQVFAHSADHQVYLPWLGPLIILTLINIVFIIILTCTLGSWCVQVLSVNGPSFNLFSLSVQGFMSILHRS